jgi:hypothetical protein
LGDRTGRGGASMHNGDGGAERMADAMERALRRVLTDEELIKAFWDRGFTEFQKHATNRGSQWVGKRLFVGAVTAAITYGAYLLIKIGGK